MSEWVTQSAWAERCGVTTRTFLRWRAAGRIPMPDVDLPGVPRWTVKLVEQTMRGFRRPAIGRPRRNHGRFQSRPSRSEHGKGSLHASALSLKDISDAHAPQSVESASGAHLNSLAGPR